MQSSHCRIGESGWSEGKKEPDDSAMFAKQGADQVLHCHPEYLRKQEYQKVPNGAEGSATRELKYL